MTYLLEFVKGIMIAIGVVFGFIILAVALLAKAKKEDNYKAKDLILPFTNYLSDVVNEERYEEIEKVQKIIAGLKKGEITEEVKDFHISSEKVLKIGKEDDSSSIWVETTWTVNRKA